MANRYFKSRQKFFSTALSLTLAIIYSLTIATSVYAEGEAEAALKIQSEIGGGEIMDFEGEAGGLSFPVNGVMWESETQMMVNNIAGPFDESEMESIKADFVDFAGSLGGNVSIGSTNSFQGYKVIEYLEITDGQESMIGWLIEYEKHLVYNVVAVPPGTTPTENLRNKIENLSSVSLKAMAEQGYIPSEKAGEEGDLDLENIAGGESGDEEAPEQEAQGGIVPGTTTTGSKYEPNSRGDVFEGGVWNSSQGESDYLERRFDSPTLISEIRIARAGTDVTTDNSSLTMKLQTPDGNWITVDSLQNTNINITSLTGGEIANSIPSYSKVLDEPVEAIAFRLEMTGNGWFSAEAIELLSGSSESVLPVSAPGGIGSVGNVPGPETTAEAVAGVVIPGVLVTVLGNALGMAGTGGFNPGGASEILIDGIEEEFQAGASDEIYYSEDNSEEVFLGEMRDETLRGERAGPEEVNDEIYDENGFDSEGYNADGYDIEGYDRGGYNVHGYNKNGLDREGFNSKGYDYEGFDREGYDSGGYDREGYDREGYNAEGYDRDGYDLEGYDQEGFDSEGYSREGFNSEGYNREGYDKYGYDREGYDRNGYDTEGYDSEGYDQSGFDSEGYSREGFNSEGYNREGYDKRGYDRDGYDSEGYNNEGFDRDGIRKDGYDSEGYDSEGFDYEGYDRNGYDRDGYDREGYDGDGYDAEGYNNEGYDRYGYDSNGYDRERYDADGYNSEGYNSEGYSVDGFDREGYDRDGYDSEGFDREGFDSEGYGRDGYDADGYSRSNHDRYGVHRDYKKKPEEPKPESGPPSQSGGPLPGRWEYKSTGIKIGSIAINPKPGPIDPDKMKNPFEEEYEWVWVPGEKPKSGEVPEEGSGIIGPEDPMNTLKNHDLGQKDSEIPESAIPEVETQEPGEWENPVISTEDGDYDPRDGYLRFPPEEGASQSPTSEVDELDYEAPVPSEPEEITMVDSLGREHTYERDPETGEYINILTGGQLDRDRWDEWNSNLGNERDWVDEQMRKLQSGDNAQDRAIEDMLENQRLQENLLKIRKDISESKDGTGMLNRGKDEPGDVITKIDKILDEAAEKGEMDLEEYEKVREIYQKARKKEIISGSEAYKPSDWEIIDAFAKTYEKTAKEVITGSDDEGNVSVLGIAGRVLISVATLGGSEIVFTPADVLITTKRLVDQGKSNAEIAKEFVKDYIMGKAIGKIGQIGGNFVSKGTKKLAQYAARKLPKTASKLQKATKWIGKELSKERHILPTKAKPPFKKPKLAKVARSPETKRQIKERLDQVKAQKAAKAKAGLEIDKNSFSPTNKKPTLEGLSSREQKGIKLAAERNQAQLVLRQKSKRATRMIERGEAYPKPEDLKLKSVKGTPDGKGLKNKFDAEFGYKPEDIDKVMLKKPKMPSRKGKTPKEWDEIMAEFKKRNIEYNDAKMDLEALMKKNPDVKWNPDTGEITYKGKPFVGDNDAFAFVDPITGKPLPAEVNARINRELQQYGVTMHNEHVSWDYSGLKNSDKVYPSGKTAYEKAKSIDKRILEESHIPGVSDEDALISYAPDGGWELLNYVGGGRNL